MLNKQKLVCGFMLMILVGLVFDTFNTINKYGYEYEMIITIGDEVITQHMSVYNSMVFMSIYGVFTLLSIMVLLEIDRTQ